MSRPSRYKTPSNEPFRIASVPFVKIFTATPLFGSVRSLTVAVSKLVESTWPITPLAPRTVWPA